MGAAFALGDVIDRVDLSDGLGGTLMGSEGDDIGGLWQGVEGAGDGGGELGDTVEIDPGGFDAVVP